MARYILGDTPQSSFWPWLTESPITATFHDSTGELGVDLAMPTGTPITSLTSGTILGAGYYGGGGIVSVETTIGGRLAAVYYQHLDLIAQGIAPGVKVIAGQVLGWSGGQLSGGHHPASSRFSTGPHLEVGINSPYAGLANPKGYGPTFDPRPWLAELARRGPGVFTFAGAGGAVLGAVHAATIPPGFMPIAQALDDAERIQPVGLFDNPLAAGLHNFGAVVARGVFVVIGLVILFGVIWYLLRDRVQAAAQTAAQLAPTAALLA